MSVKLNPVVDHTFSSLIWKLESDAANDLLYIETRSAENQSTGFSSFNIKTGQVNFLELVPEEKWLVGMDGGRKGILFLYGYKSGQSPEHKGIIALNGLTGKQVWADYNLVLETFTKEGIVAADQRFQTKRNVLLDYKTGNALTDIKNQQDDVEPVQYPFMLRLLPENIAALITGTITGDVCCLNYNSYLIISLHSKNNGYLVQQLFIIENDTLIYHDLLNENIQKLQPEAFVLIKNHLVYLKNKINLKVLNL
ncbi:DUF4905 domain-containing protein [Mucilaginibacter arboris]|uniref:DUF4905 domain-containing protein n=1 Tax=Mucilaginibacter arboris TaxID=2682090 RepID=A0A7K1SWU4_9SPHI|nr:DUF4905 domain-containing protein [Mucilaginibacter arboris]MVN21728.1 DUF4905 domain-containing protein [Mucilaginibacter arboris]